LFSSRLQETHSNEAPWKPWKLLNPWCFLPVICAPGKFAGKTGSSPVSAQKDSAISARSAGHFIFLAEKMKHPMGGGSIHSREDSGWVTFWEWGLNDADRIHEKNLSIYP